MRFLKHISGAFFLLLTFNSCVLFHTAPTPDISVGYQKLNTGEDPAFAETLKPYRAQLEAKMNAKVAVATGDFTLQRPEGTLNNLMGDIMRRWASHVSKQRIHIGLMNYGGIRTQWSAGTLTVGDVYEMMPFDNRMVLLQLNGDSLRSFANELAKKGGEAVSGIRFAIDENGNASDVLVAGFPVSSDSLYWVACSDYIANNPDYMQSILNPVKRIDFDLMIRDAIIEYLKSKETIEPQLDGRVRKR